MCARKLSAEGRLMDPGGAVCPSRTLPEDIYEKMKWGRS